MCRLMSRSLGQTRKVRIDESRTPSRCPKRAATRTLIMRRIRFMAVSSPNGCGAWRWESEVTQAVSRSNSVQDRGQKRPGGLIVQAEAHQRHRLDHAQTMPQAPTQQL